MWDTGCQQSQLNGGAVTPWPVQWNVTNVSNEWMGMNKWNVFVLHPIAGTERKNTMTMVDYSNSNSKAKLGSVLDCVPHCSLRWHTTASGTLYGRLA